MVKDDAVEKAHYSVRVICQRAARDGRFSSPMFQIRSWKFFVEVKSYA